MRRVLVTGASGFVGRALVPALLASGAEVRATTRRLDSALKKEPPGLQWVRCDVGVRADLEQALQDVEAAYFLVHGMGGGRRDYAAVERRHAEQFRDVAARAGVKRILYLGGVAPAATPSEHLQSRLRVGEILRSGEVPTLELRASMIIGNGSASWRIVRDLALRLPAMLLPSWTASRSRPIALEDAIVALVRGLDIPLSSSVWYDIPGPDTLSGREIFLGIAALRGRRVPSLKVPFLSVSLSSWWLKLVTRADFSLARELVLGFTGDLLPDSDRYWSLIGYTPNWTFEACARHALDEEKLEKTCRGIAGRVEEELIQLLGPKLTRS